MDISILVVHFNIPNDSENRGHYPRKDEAYPQQIFSYKTTDGASDTVKKEKCYYLETNQSCCNNIK